MERKILITGIVLAICISVIIGVIFIYSSTKTGANPLKVIPQDVAYVVRLNGIGIAEVLKSEKTKVWKDLTGLKLFANIHNEISILDSLFNDKKLFSEDLSEQQIFVSGHYSGGKNINHLVVFNVPASFKEKSIEGFLAKQTNRRISSFSMRKYEGKTIFSVSLTTKRILYLSLANGVLIYGGSPVLVEDAIRQSTLNISLLDNPGFNEMISATGKNKDANLFIDFSQLGRLISLLGNNTFATKLKSFEKLGSWSELDINVKSNLLFLNGFTRQSTESNLLSTISQNNPVRLTIEDVLPSTIAAFIAFGLSDAEESYSKYLEYLDELGKLSRYQANLSNMNSKYGVDFEKLFLSHIDDELALVYKKNVNTATGSHYLVMKSKSGSELEKELIALTQKISELNNAAKTQSYSPDKTVRFNIHKIPIYPLFGWVLGDFFDVFEECYFTVVDNYMVVAGSYEDASQFIYSYILQKTLSNDEIYRDFAENISVRSYTLGYFNLQQASGFFSRYGKEELLKDWEQNIQVFNNTKTAGFQISEVSGMPYFNVFLNRMGNVRGKPKTVWESLLDTTLSFKPVFLVNHYTKQNEIFIQDDKNNVYLINQAGRILWKFLLPEKINSEIYQIDYYKNGKLQMLFSTDNYIHLIDRNGNYVENYPIRLRNKATAGLALFDYDDTKDYRIFIPCADKKVYAYRKEGTLLPGWGFERADHNVNTSIEHFRVEEKDFIVFADKSRTYILDRKGNDRVLVKGDFSKSPNNKFYLQNTDQVTTSYLVTTNPEGDIIKIYFDGNTEKVQFTNFTAEHFFDYKDINADGKSDYIFLDKNILQVFDNGGTTLFKKDMKVPITQKPVYYHFSHNNRKIGLVSEEEEQIFLINNNGDMYKNFPLEGKTLFSIGYFDLTSSRFNLIVGGRNNFLYNYAVE
jgi:hypothetical protein